MIFFSLSERLSRVLLPAEVIPRGLLCTNDFFLSGWLSRILLRTEVLPAAFYSKTIYFSLAGRLPRVLLRAEVIPRNGFLESFLDKSPSKGLLRTDDFFP